MSDHDVDLQMQRLREIGAGEAEGSGLVPLLAALVSRLDAIDQHLVAHDQRFDAIDRRLDTVDHRLDELTAEVSLQRAALERFGFMGKAPKPPTADPSYGGGSGLPVAAKGSD